ncbi:Glycosyltransferase involved in cell wall bisynthesis [Enhydrobacter aerosaccus]|uniref:Glycosyltransferase involved in cell wall bisynthesis n=1 Tax=Enhydrobacter aerosaccus TaxID=225324 RepID=A0A1T4T9T6_9HYPH|nr:glycosyltransferase [Enhydrobacter aerosaccus]SKA37222.1 Glycosyltransferase involved in cell wall bisynthesis [Enhydrobacter aerosaccus]
MTLEGSDTGSKRLRIAHCVGFYFPEGMGGTEVYVQDLRAALMDRSIDGYVIAATDKSFEQYVWEGVPVVRYPSNWAGIRDYSAARSRAGLSKFQELILQNAPDIFHLHSWTSGAGLTHLAQVAQLGIPCVVTMHVPSALCLRGTMLLHGREACDGRIDDKRCAQCWAASRGLPPALANAVSSLPRRSWSGGWTSRISSKAVTLLSARSRAVVQALELHRMAEFSERIVAPSQWVYSALLANGVAPEKLRISRQAVSRSLTVEAQRLPHEPAKKDLTIGFIGRLEHYKGAHILLEAMAQIPRDVPIRLRIAGTGTELPYLRTLEQAAGSDKRIEFCGGISREQVPDFLRQVDILAVPSNYMETGPLVVLEAYAFGVPVMGANLGGIAERVRDGIDGWLLPFDDSRAWAVAMREAAQDRSRLQRLTANILPSRTMGDVADEMAVLYREIIGGRLSLGHAETVRMPADRP